MSLKTYKYHLYPNIEVTKKLSWTLARCRELYNAALSEYKDAYKRHIRTRMYQNEHGQWIIAEMQANMRVNDVSYVQQANMLPEIKRETRNS